jgi:hypothetical protein
MPNVNQKLPEKERIPLYATDWNGFLILRKHKEIYPLSKVRDVMYALFIGAGATLFVAFLMTWTQADKRGLFGNGAGHLISDYPSPR